MVVVPARTSAAPEVKVTWIEFSGFLQADPIEDRQPPAMGCEEPLSRSAFMVRLTGSFRSSGVLDRLQPHHAREERSLVPNFAGRN